MKHEKEKEAEEEGITNEQSQKTHYKSCESENKVYFLVT